MAQTKLTNYSRNVIRGRLLKPGFERDVQALYARFALFAVEVYDDVYSPHIRAKMGALPKGWLPTTEHICVRFGGDDARLSFNGHAYNRLFDIATEQPQPQDRRVRDHDKGRFVMAYGHDSEMTTGYLDLRVLWEDLTRNMNEAWNVSGVVIADARTVEGLLKSWPEAEPYCKDLLRAKVDLPDIPRDRLNKMLGLPA